MAFGGVNVPGKINPEDIGAANSDHKHSANDITSDILPIERGGLGNDSGYVRAGQKAGTTIGRKSTAEGEKVTASGDNAHAEGRNTTASGDYSHAEGFFPTASNSYAHAEGYYSTASGLSSHAEGYESTASGESSHSGGEGTYAEYMAETAIGRYNVQKKPSSQGTLGDLFVIGKGTSDTERANVFRVTTTAIYGTGSYNSTGADYAELFEWADGNPDKEDRAGLFVTLDGEKIRVATPQDDFILGIISGNPSIIGDVHDDQWQGMYLYDIFGRPLWEAVEVPEETIEESDPENPEQTITRVLIPSHTEHRQKINPDYDNSKPYIPRSERPEWGCVGMLGKLVVIDDGTCQINACCTVGEGGKATHSNAETKFRVMARIDECHVRVLVL